MFDILKKKLSSFVKGITEKVSASAQEKPEEKIPKPEGEVSRPAEHVAIETETVAPIIETEKPATEPPVAAKKIEGEKAEQLPKPKMPVAAKAKEEIEPIAQTAPIILTTPTAQKETSWKPVEKAQRGIAPDLGIVSKIKGLFSSQVEITEAETRGMFDELQTALLESDVSPDTATALVNDLKGRLVGRMVAKSEVEAVVKAEISAAVTSVFVKPEDLLQMAKQKAAADGVFTIMFLGPNGAGKTTTIAKLAQRFKDAGLYAVISASDTFRAAAIEQAGIHAEKIGIKIIKQSYGSDPAAVAFDAIKHAKSVGNAVVLIDTAGRQETNRNLVEEMKKIQRVVKPDYRVFVGEALAGHSLVDQVKAFDAAVGIDGIILTKLDCDPKGGNAISIAHDAGKPILFFGVGQEYGDLVPFDPGFVVRKVLEAG